MAIDIIKLFSARWPYQSSILNAGAVIPRGIPSAGALNRGLGEILQFLANISQYLEVVQDRPVVAVEH